MCRVSASVKRVDMLGTVWAKRCQGKCNIAKWWTSKFWTMQICEDPMRQLNHPFTLYDKDHFHPTALSEHTSWGSWVRTLSKGPILVSPLTMSNMPDASARAFEREMRNWSKRKWERGREGERGKEGERGGVRVLSWRCESGVLSMLDGRFRSVGGKTKRQKGWKKRGDKRERQGEETRAGRTGLK